MNQRYLKFVLAGIFVLIIGVFATKPEYRWLVLYGHDAAEYAESLISGGTLSTPDWAVDLIVVKENDVVTFGEHNADKIVAFSLSGKPIKEGIVWSHVWGSWYVGVIRP